MKQLGYAEELIEEAIGHAENVPDEVKEARKLFRDLYAQYRAETDREHDEVVSLGGLIIIGTERHESRRIDNQLRGRAGRQGDPGSSQFFISLEDDLMRLFGSDRIQPLIERLKIEEGQAIEYGILSKQIEGAQKKVEARNYDIRKSVLQFDDVMNQQRELIYRQRREVLEGDDIMSHILGLRESLIGEAVDHLAANEQDETTWDIPGIAEYLERICLKTGDVKAVFDSLQRYDRDSFKAALIERSAAFYQEREKTISEAGIDMREFERVALLGAVDRRWMDHIDAMDQLRDGIGLRAYGHKDPIVEYKIEGFNMFEEMSRLIQEDTLRRLYMAVLVKPPERKEAATPVAATHGGSDTASPKQPVKAGDKVGRNAPCPCGSGKKYKECCGKGQ